MRWISGGSTGKRNQKDTQGNWIESQRASNSLHFGRIEPLVEDPSGIDRSKAVGRRTTGDSPARCRARPRGMGQDRFDYDQAPGAN